MTGRRERRKQETRRALVDAATLLFSERGIWGTRLEDITERADLGKGAFYNYFDSKDALVAEVVSRGVDVVEAHLRAAGGTTPAQRVQAVVDALEAFAREKPEYVLLFHQARGLVKLGTGGTARLREVLGRYLGLIEAALALPGSAEERLDRAAVVAGAAAGYRSFRLAVGHQPDAATLTRALTEGLLS